MLDEAVQRNAKELLVLTGEKPEVNPVVAAKLAEPGATRTSPPTSSGPANGRWSAACSRTRTSACSAKEDLARLREVTASQGLMLESVSERLMETVHAGSPTKHPARAPGDDRGRRRAEDPVHERHPGRHRRDARRSGSNRSKRSPTLHERYGHIQEVILQNFVPHPRYYGRGGGRDRRRGIARALGGMGDAPPVANSGEAPGGASAVRPADVGRCPVDRSRRSSG